MVSGACLREFSGAFQFRFRGVSKGICDLFWVIQESFSRFQDPFKGVLRGGFGGFWRFKRHCYAFEIGLGVSGASKRDHRCFRSVLGFIRGVLWKFKGVSG